MLLRKWATILLVTLTLCAAWWLAFTRTTQAGATCAQSYTVQVGDTLSAIARQFSTTVTTLVEINHLRSPNLLLVGQVLCLQPTLAADTPTATEPGLVTTPTTVVSPTPPVPAAVNLPKVAVEASYVFTPTDDEALLVLAQTGQIGKRVEFMLDNLAAIELVTNTTALVNQVNEQNLPTLWVARLGNDNVLVSGGDHEPLAPLRITASGVITPFVEGANCTRAPITQIIEPNPALQLTHLNVWLEGADGLRYPFSITKIAHANSHQTITRCFRQNPYLALFPLAGSTGERFRAVLVVRKQGDPTPWAGAAAACETLASGGWWSRLVYVWRGC